MDYLASISEGEKKLREIELDTTQYGPPKGMDDQAWAADRGYLLFIMRLYARKLYYENWARKENIKLEEADFEAMNLMLKHRAKKINKELPLLAFRSTIETLKLNPNDPETPKALEETLVHIVNAREKIEEEDSVHLISYLAGYAKYALNQGMRAYASISLQCQIPAIEVKYGKNWKGKPALPYKVLTNLACSAMNLNASGDWRGLTMELVRDVGMNGSVYDWIEELLKAYKSRLDKKFRAPSVCYVRARSAFFQEKYAETAKQLMLIGKQPYEFFGHSIRQLRLMTYYELLYCQGTSTRPLARQLEPNPRATISNMRSNITYTDKDQARKTYQLDYYRTFSDGLSMLLNLKEQAEKLPEGSAKRFSALHNEKPQLINSLKGSDLFAIKWLHRQALDLY